MDLLSQILESAAWKTDVISREHLHAPWGMIFPCNKSGGFHIITQGECLLRKCGKKEGIWLQKGDVVYLARGILHELVSSAEVKALDLQTFLRKQREGRIRPDSKTTTLLSVRYEEPDRTPHPFFQELPEIIHIQGSEIPGHHPLHTTLQLISRELEHAIGSDLILQRLSDILLYCVIRHWMEVNRVEAPGWRSAFFDDKIRHALENLHSRYRQPWTIEALAASVGLSRATLAARFRRTLDMAPMEYLTDLRIEKGRSLLQRGDMSLEEVASQVGYSSAFAFSKAYKRLRGVAPTLEAKAM